jgi:hypothetical protein
MLEVIFFPIFAVFFASRAAHYNTCRDKKNGIDLKTYPVFAKLAKVDVI